MADQAEESGENPPEESKQELENVPSDEAPPQEAAEHHDVSGASLLDDDEDEDEAQAEQEEEVEEYELLDDENNPMAVLPDYVVRRVDKLLDLNSERDKIMDDYLKERAALEAKYQSLCQPLYEKRLEIVRGDHDAAIAKETGTEDEAANAGETAVGIPQFWVCAMGHMEAVAENVTEEDVNCLEHLQNVTCEDDPEGTAFTLRFYFAPNDYFEDTVLTKRYEVPNLLLADEPILKNVEGCKIRWKEGKSLTYRTVKKKQRGKGKNSGQIRTVNKKERKESFFHFFEPPKMPSMEDMDEEQADQLEELFDSDYDMAQAFRSHIIPKAALWFTGQAMQEEMAEMLGDEALAAGIGSGASRSNPFPPSAPGEQPPECQQN